MAGHGTFEDLESVAAEIAAELGGSRNLSAADRFAIEAVIGLDRRRQQAQLILEAEGPVAAKESGEPIEHPAAKVERNSSAEIRGWVKDRPDLFGAAESGDGEDKKVGVFPGLKSVR